VAFLYGSNIEQVHGLHTILSTEGTGAEAAFVLGTLRALLRALLRCQLKGMSTEGSSYAGLDDHKQQPEAKDDQHAA
jgi:hypothetical protein